MLRVVTRRLLILKRDSERSVIGPVLEGGSWQELEQPFCRRALPPSVDRKAEVEIEDNAACPLRSPTLGGGGVWIETSTCWVVCTTAPQQGCWPFQEASGLWACFGPVRPCAHLHHYSSSCVNELFGCLSPLQTLNCHSTNTVIPCLLREIAFI